MKSGQFAQWQGEFLLVAVRVEEEGETEMVYSLLDSELKVVGTYDSKEEVTHAMKTAKLEKAKADAEANLEEHKAAAPEPDENAKAAKAKAKAERIAARKESQAAKKAEEEAAAAAAAEQGGE